MVQSAFVIQRGLLPVKPGKNILDREEKNDRRNNQPAGPRFYDITELELADTCDIIDEILLACQLVIFCSMNHRYFEIG